MRTNFSPTAAAARLLATRGVETKPVSPSNPPLPAPCCEWPRRAPAAAPRAGIWRALQEIQMRHA